MKPNRSKIAAAIDRMFKTKATGQKRIYPDGRRTSAEQDALCNAIFGADLCDQATQPGYFKATKPKPATARKAIDQKAITKAVAAKIATKANAQAQRAIDDLSAQIRQINAELDASNRTAKYLAEEKSLRGNPYFRRGVPDKNPYYTNGVH